MHYIQLRNWNNCDLLHPLIYEYFRKYKFVNMVSVKNANQSNSINTSRKKTNDMFTIKLPFCYYTVKLIECMISKMINDLKLHQFD